MMTKSQKQQSDAIRAKKMRETYKRNIQAEAYRTLANFLEEKLDYQELAEAIELFMRRHGIAPKEVSFSGHIEGYEESFKKHKDKIS